MMSKTIKTRMRMNRMQMMKIDFLFRCISIYFNKKPRQCPGSFSIEFNIIFDLKPKVSTIPQRN